jgi:hypothetical protein
MQCLIRCLVRELPDITPNERVEKALRQFGIFPSDSKSTELKQQSLTDSHDDNLFLRLPLMTSTLLPYIDWISVCCSVDLLSDGKIPNCRSAFSTLRADYHNLTDILLKSGIKHQLYTHHRQGTPEMMIFYLHMIIRLYQVQAEDKSIQSKLPTCHKP